MKITKSQLRQLIREEVKSLINEATRWMVGIEAPSGKIATTYGHWDEGKNPYILSVRINIKDLK